MASKNQKKVTAKPVIFDTRTKVKVTATAKHPFYKEGEEYTAHPRIADLNVKQGFCEPYVKAEAEAEGT